MSDASLISVLVRIHGKVQGVWYRAWTVREAQARGIDGWVRNGSDGSVEALFAGPAPVVRELIELCRRGPPAARVERIEEAQATRRARPGFEQWPTV